MELSKLQRLQKILFAGINFRKICAFTLAEMMVVMLIMSIIMAAMAPVMTRKQKTDTSSPWKWSAVGSPHAYFGVNGSQTALIGQRAPVANEPASKLIINASGDDVSHILLKHGNESRAFSVTSKGGIILGPTAIDKAGTNSVAIGSNSVSAGGNAIAIGNGAVTSNVDNPIAIGRASGASAENSLAIGDAAIANDKVSVSIGSSAHAEAEGAIAIGSRAKAGGTYQEDGETKVKGINSITIGNGASATSNNAIAIGYCASTTSNNSIAIGPLVSIEKQGSIAIGNSIGMRELNTVIGYHAMYLEKERMDFFSTSTVPAEKERYANTVIGYSAAQNLTNGSFNTVVGHDALKANGLDLKHGGQLLMSMPDTGSRNTAIGYQAMYESSSAQGSNNIAIGYRALSGLSIAGNNLASIDTSDENLNNWNNIAIGSGALFSNKSGSGNIAIGYKALYKNSVSKKADNNIAIGDEALMENLVGNNNIAIGVGACKNVKGNNKVCIGHGSGPTSETEEQEHDEAIRYEGRGSYYGLDPQGRDKKSKIIYLGDSDTVVYIPGELVVSGVSFLGYGLKAFGKKYDRITWPYGFDSSLYAHLGGSDFGEPIISESFAAINANSFGRSVLATPSDRRLKYVGAENKDGLAKLRQLKVFNYTFKKDEKKTPHVGVMAQDLQKVFPKAVKKGEDGFLFIRMEDMFYAVINAIKELDAKVTTLINSAQQLQKENARLSKELKQVRYDNKQLQKRLEALEKAK